MLTNQIVFSIISLNKLINIDAKFELANDIWDQIQMNQSIMIYNSN